MPPFLSAVNTYFNSSAILPSFFRHTDSSSELLKQWKNPFDSFSVLLLLGPDVIRCALAQLSGEWLTPVPFSFGWVAYALVAVLAAVGDGNLLPAPESSLLVIGAKTGHVRSNRSWAIARLFRDYEYRTERKIVRNEDDPEKRESLRVSVFQAESAGRQAGVPVRDWVWYSGFVVMACQIGISLIPLCLHTNYAIFLVTIAGTMLALMHGALPQWKREKWSAVGTGDGYTVSLTLGNGSRHVMVILGNDLGFDMEILAAGNVRFRLSLWERIGLLMLAILWIGLLITIAGVSEGTWYVLAIGLIGILHNLLVAGAPREPSASGFHLRHVDTFFANKVVKVLRKTEERYPLVGSSLIPIFFPAGLRIKDSESVFWEMANQRRKDLDLGQLHLRIDK